jgi:phage-related protein
MSTQAKVIIKGQNSIGPAVKSAAKDLSGLKDSADKLGSAIKTAFSVTAIIASVKMLGNAVSDCFQNFAGAERSYRQLALAIGDTEAYSRIVEVIGDLSRQTLQGKDGIESMVAELAALGKSADEIEKISSASVYLSNVTGKELTSSMTTLLNTYNGTTTQLKKLGIDVRDLTRGELEQGAAVDRVIESLGEYSKAMAEADTSQHLVNIKNTWGDIKQAVGGILDYNFGPFIGQFDTWFSGAYTNIAGIVNYIGAVIANLPAVAGIALDTIGAMLSRTFEWDSIKTIFTSTIENIFTLAGAAIKALFLSLPEALDALATGIVTWIGYIGASIRTEISSAIADAFSIGWLEALKNPLSRLLMRDQEVTFNGETKRLGDFSKREQNEIIDFIKKGAGAAFMSLTDGGMAKDPEGTFAKYANMLGMTSAEDQKKASDDAFARLGDIFSESFSDVLGSLGTVVSNTGQAAQDIYGGIFDEFKAAVDAVIMPDLKLIPLKSEASDQSDILGSEGKPGSGGSEGSGGKDGEPPKILDWNTVFSDIKASWDSAISKESADSSAFSSLSSSLGKLKEAVSPLADMLFSTNPLIAALSVIIEGFVSVMAPALKTVIQPVMDALAWIGESLGGALLPLLDAIQPVMAIIGNLLVTVIGPVVQLLSPAIELVALVLSALTPAIAGIGKAFTILMSPVQYVADLFSWLGKWLAYMGDCVAVCAWNLTHWFSQKEYGSSPGSFSSDAFTGLGERIGQWDSFGLSGTAATDSVSTGTAVSGASYQGATQVTINVYQQAPVVGDGGMRAFARMIRSEFEELDYYGVT